MEKRKIATVLDNIILVLGIWLLSYLWTRYYVMNLLVALIAATGIAMCVIMLINIKRQKNKNSRKKQKQIDNIMNQFLYGGKDFSINFLFDALNKKFNTLNKNLTAEKKENFILAGKTAVFPKFSLLQINLEQLIDCYVAAKKAGCKKMIILSICGCDKFSKQYIYNMPDMRLDIFSKNKCYDFLGYLDSFPETTIQVKQEKISLKKLLISALNPSKSKHYLVISIVLMISSYFVIYSIYYIVAASVILILSLLSRIDIKKRITSKKG